MTFTGQVKTPAAAGKATLSDPSLRKAFVQDDTFTDLVPVRPINRITGMSTAGGRSLHG